MNPISGEFKMGTLVPATVVITDQFSRECRADVGLFINKREKHVGGASSSIRLRGGLSRRKTASHRRPTRPIGPWQVYQTLWLRGWEAGLGDRAAFCVAWLASLGC